MVSSVISRESISGVTKVAFIVGQGVGGLRSPALFSGIFQEHGKNAVMLAADVKMGDLRRFLDGAAVVRNLAGLIITMPHKLEAYAACADVSERARVLEAVNVMRRSDDGCWAGDNFDGVGFVEALRTKSSEFGGSSALIFGAGGVGTAISHELLCAGIGFVAVVDSDGTKSRRLAAKLSSVFPHRIGVGAAEKLAGFRYVVNATPLGMRQGDPAPFDVSAVDEDAVVGDVVTTSECTSLVKTARQLGHATVTGAEMLNAQALLHMEFMLG
jgi:shikimate dehydrogenase